MTEAIQTITGIMSTLAGGMHRLAAGDRPPERASPEAIDLHRLAYRLARICLLTAACLIGFSIYRVATISPFLLLLAVAALGRRAIRKGVPLTAYGTARWAHAHEIPQQTHGLLIGTVADNGPRRILPLFHPGIDDKAACKSLLATRAEVLVRPEAVHWSVFAPTGAGKGVSCVLPHLLTCEDSIVSVDFKTENLIIAGDARRAMGRVVALNPFGCMAKPGEPLHGMPFDTFNPLDFIDKASPLAIDEVKALASELVITNGNEKEPFWNQSAEAFISALTAAAVVYGRGENRTLQAVRSQLSDPVLLAAMIEIMSDAPECEGMLSRLAKQLQHFREKQLSIVLASTNRHLDFMDSVPVRDCMMTSSFDPAELVTGTDPMSIFMTIPPDQIATKSALLRMWIGSFLRAVVKCGLQERRLVHFILDEAASLGRMNILDQAVDKYRGYGVRCQFYYQSMGQLHACWPDGRHQTLLSNSAQIFFAVNDFETAKYVSDRPGQATIITTTGGENRGTSASADERGGGNRGTSGGSTSGWNQAGRSLLTPDEVLCMDKRIAITFLPGVRPVWSRMVRYYEPEFSQTPTTLWPAVRTLGLAVVGLVVAAVVAMTVCGVFHLFPSHR